MIRIQGYGVSAGVGMGPLYFYRRGKTVIERYKVTDEPAEWARFHSAMMAAVRQLNALAEKARAEGNDEGAKLLETHAMLAQDEDFLEAMRSEIMVESNNAEAAVTDTAARFAGMFAAMDNEYMQSRAADIRDVAGRINDILMGNVRGGIDSEVPVILAADELQPSETIQLDKTKILGFVTAGGSSAGHTAILARTMGIPAVINVGDALRPAMAGREVIVDGETGVVIVRPTEKTRAEMQKKQEEQERQKNRLEYLRGVETVTRDGHKVRLACNIASLDDIPAVKKNDGGEIGLFRSEFLYLSSSDYPSEETQFEAYREALIQMQGRQVIIRTMDIGADKQVSYFGLEHEENPALGMRALRLCLSRPGVFATQLRALYRASAYGKLAIMFPMVSSVWEVREAKRMCQVAMADLEERHLPYDKNVQLGIMVETPAAVLLSDRLAKEADFFSVGTNDLLQYTAACDRQGSGLSRFYDPHHPAVLRSLSIVTENAHKNGIWVGVCGELAADPEMTETLLGIGVDELSVAPGEVLPLRGRIRLVDAGKARDAAMSELSADSEG